MTPAQDITLPRWWNCVLKFALVLWVVRVPLGTTALGLFLLGWVPQAQDLFLEFGWASPERMALFAFVLVAVWAMPTHYAARMLLDTDSRLQNLLAAEEESGLSRCLASSALWVPRVLGLVTFAGMLFGIWRSNASLPNFEDKDTLVTAKLGLFEATAIVVAGAAVYLIWVFFRPRSVKLPGWLDWINKRLGVLWQLLSPGRLPNSADEQNRDIGRLILTGLFLAFVAIFVLGEESAAHVFARAVAIPIILGGWLPFLSYLSAVGRQIRVPLIVLLWVGILGLVSWLGDNHSVRAIAADSNASRADMPLEQVVSLWMAENGCGPNGDHEGPVKNCPRPIIIAAAGGASRAAFFMATTIGYFIREADKHGLDGNQVRNRLFAISGVSGGSLGAVMVTAALNTKSDTSKTNHPCVTGQVALWWGKSVSDWRDCFEALTSDDFLTADFFGFAFNDMLPLRFWRDRAAVLEDSWSNRFRMIITNPDKSTSCQQGLDCPFLSLQPRAGHWIPVLVLNGTSEATGSRIVTTALASTYKPYSPTDIGTAKGADRLWSSGICPTTVRPPPCPLFVEASQFHYLLNPNVPPGARYDDVRLSTAVHNSARFPLISPPGVILNREHKVVDRILDGGYFENYGTLSAKELALAVHAVQPQLAPVVVVISNDPNDFLDSDDDSNSKSKGSHQQDDLYAKQKLMRSTISGREFFTDVIAPVDTVANTRTAHGILSVDQLQTTLHEAIPACDVLVIKIRVWPLPKQQGLSMSWWESIPIQIRLRRQLEPKYDQNENEPHLQGIWRVLNMPSSCVVATQ
jgi:hypothetical protein